MSLKGADLRVETQKRRAEALPQAKGTEVDYPLAGTNPDGDYICCPRASVVRPDFHWLAVLNPCVRTHTCKTGHAYFNLKFRASGISAVPFHCDYF